MIGIKSPYLKASKVQYIKSPIKYNHFNGVISSLFLCVKLLDLDKEPHLKIIGGVVMCLDRGQCNPVEPVL